MNVQSRVQESVIGFKLKGADKPGRIMRWHVIAGLCLQSGYRKGAEIGVSQGRFTMFLCAVMHDLQMIAVDRWEEQPEHKTEGWVGWDHEGHYRRFKTNCEQYFPERVNVVRGDSVSAAENIEDGSLDFVFIDADHSYEGCARDIAAWAPKVRSGGMISGHDYNMKWPGVVKSVDEYFPGKKISHDSVWIYFQK